jgi:osmotically inducible lipoprotein OsmB
MLSLNKKFCAMTLGLILMFAAAMPVSAQWGYRDRGMSNKKKALIIGGGAAAGAALGAVLGGKKGAVIGGVLGAGGGTGYVVLKERRDRDRYGYYDGRDDYRYRDGYRYSRRYRR